MVHRVTNQVNQRFTESFHLVLLQFDFSAPDDEIDLLSLPPCYISYKPGKSLKERTQRNEVKSPAGLRERVRESLEVRLETFEPRMRYGLHRRLETFQILRHALGIEREIVNQVLEQGKQRLAEGLWILLFPEGTRVMPGRTRKYGLSGALLASQTGAKLVPVAHNAGDYWARRGLLKKPGTVRVVIGPPIEGRGRDPRALNDQAQAWVEGKMAEISAGYR